MNNIKETIRTLCPNGVPFFPLCEITDLTAGDRITKGDMSDDQEYPAMGAGIVPTGWSNDWNRENCVTISRAGAGAGSIGWQPGKFWATDVCFVAAQKEDGPLIKYVFYAMKSKEKELKTHIYGGSMPKIDKKYLWNLQLPVPPIAIQQEIIDLLDHYADDCGKLITTLDAELIARKQQFEYYRKRLFEFKNGSYKTQPIINICKKITSGGTPKTSHKEYYGGSIPWLRTQEVNWEDIYDTEVKITEEGVINSSAKMIPANCVIVAMYGATAAKTAINRIPLTTNQACCNLQVNEDIAMVEYVYYWLIKEYKTLKGLGRGSQNNINAEMIKSFPIQIPSLEMQKEVVTDMKDLESAYRALFESIESEKKLRQAEFEYYRDAVLSFSEAS